MKNYIFSYSQRYGYNNNICISVDLQRLISTRGILIYLKRSTSAHILWELNYLWVYKGIVGFNLKHTKLFLRFVVSDSSRFDLAFSGIVSEARKLYIIRKNMPLSSLLLYETYYFLDDSRINFYVRVTT